MTNSQRTILPRVAMSVVLALTGTALAARAQASPEANTVYARCAACHLPTGEGAPGLAPPLARRLGHLATIEGGRDYLVLVLQSGLMGRIEVQGVEYQNVMPAQALKDEEIAGVLNYVLEIFNQDSLPKDWRRFTVGEVAAIKARHPEATLQDIQVLRNTVFAEQ